MNYFKNLPKEFISSAVRQIGRDGGRVISNKIYKGNHSTPFYNSAINHGVNSLNQSDVLDIINIDLTIQPKIKGGNFWVIIKGFLIQIIPLGTLFVLSQGYIYRKTTDANIYVQVPNRISDRRFKAGYRIDGFSIIKTKQLRQLNEDEIEKIRKRGNYYLISIPVFFIIGYLIYLSQ